MPKVKTDTTEFDQKAADEGFVWGLELHHYTRYSRADLLTQGFTESDLERVDRVLALRGMAIPKVGSEPVVAEKTPVEEG
jgi:hypothetical protein